MDFGALDGDGDDLEFLVALAGNAGPGQGPQGRRPRVQPTAAGASDNRGDQLVPQAPADVVADPEVQEEVGQPVARRQKHPQRSWQALEKARAAKALKRSQQELEHERAQRRRLESTTSLVAAEFPIIASAIGIVPKRLPMNDDRAVVQMKLAMLPTIRHDAQHAKAQARAVGAVAACIRQAQGDMVRNLFFSCMVDLDAMVDGLDGPLSGEDRPTVLALDWQWDETSQRVRAIPTKTFIGERVSHARMSVQVMSQSGATRAYIEDESARRLKEVHKVAHRAERAAPAHRLAAGIALQLLRCRRDVQSVCAMHTPSGLRMCMGRAAANFRTLGFIWRALQAPGMPLNIYPWAENHAQRMALRL